MRTTATAVPRVGGMRGPVRARRSPASSQMLHSATARAESQDMRQREPGEDPAELEQKSGGH